MCSSACAAVLTRQKGHAIAKKTLNPLHLLLSNICVRKPTPLTEWKGSLADHSARWKSKWTLPQTQAAAAESRRFLPSIVVFSLNQTRPDIPEGRAQAHHNRQRDSDSALFSPSCQCNFFTLRSNTATI